MVSKSVPVSTSHFDKSVCELPLDTNTLPRMVNVKIIFEDSNGFLRMELGTENRKSKAFIGGYEGLSYIISGSRSHLELLSECS